MKGRKKKTKLDRKEQTRRQYTDREDPENQSDYLSTAPPASHLSGGKGVEEGGWRGWELLSQKRGERGCHDLACFVETDPRRNKGCAPAQTANKGL